MAEYILTRPILHERIGKWMLILSEYTSQYVLQNVVKGQVLAKFLLDHPCLPIEADSPLSLILEYVSLKLWTLMFDGSKIDEAAGIGILLISREVHSQFSFHLAFACSNNQAKYEVLIIGLEICWAMP